MPILLPSVFMPFQRREARAQYRQRFGTEYPSSLTYEKYGNDWQSEVADIDRRIRENDPA